MEGKKMVSFAGSLAQRSAELVAESTHRMNKFRERVCADPDTVSSQGNAAAMAKSPSGVPQITSPKTASNSQGATRTSLDTQDADLATEYARNNILSQRALASLAHVNVNSQRVQSLLFQ